MQEGGGVELVQLTGSGDGRPKGTGRVPRMCVGVWGLARQDALHVGPRPAAKRAAGLTCRSKTGLAATMSLMRASRNCTALCTLVSESAHSLQPWQAGMRVR